MKYAALVLLLIATTCHSATGTITFTGAVTAFSCSAQVVDNAVAISGCESQPIAPTVPKVRVYVDESNIMTLEYY